MAQGQIRTLKPVLGNRLEVQEYFRKQLPVLENAAYRLAKLAQTQSEQVPGLHDRLMHVRAVLHHIVDDYWPAPELKPGHRPWNKGMKYATSDPTPINSGQRGKPHKRWSKKTGTWK